MGVDRPNRSQYENPARAIANATDKVRIGGAPGYVNQPEQNRLLVTWMPSADEALVVHVRDVPDMRSTALRVAESVKPDTAVLRPALTLGQFTGSSFPSGVDGN